MTENVDYELVPSDWLENQEGWDIRILKGEYTETVLRFGKIKLVDEHLHFNFDVIMSPDDLTADDEELQVYAGQVLNALIERALENDELITKSVED